MLGEKRLVERAPVDADADGFLMLDSDLDHGAEVVVVFSADRDNYRGLMRYLERASGTIGIFASEELVAVVVEVAHDGSVPALNAGCLRRCAGTALAASSLLTVMRTSSLPARASAAICWTVLSISAVSVLVMDCTTTGAPEPTMTPPMLTLMDVLRVIEGI